GWGGQGGGDPGFLPPAPDSLPSPQWFSHRGDRPADRPGPARAHPPRHLIELTRRVTGRRCASPIGNGVAAREAHGTPSSRPGPPWRDGGAAPSLLRCPTMLVARGRRPERGSDRDPCGTALESRVRRIVADPLGVAAGRGAPRRPPPGRAGAGYAPP